MGKFISNLFLGALALGLSLFTASRTLDLLGWALPAGQVIYQWLGLAAFEGGMYFWSFFFVAGAKGTPQRSISLCMAIFSVIAVCVATVADLSLGASETGKIAPLSSDMQQTMIIFVGVVIALNVTAFLASHLMAPEKLREIKSGVAEDMIFNEGLRAIEALAPSMAAEAAPHLAAEWSNRTWQRIVPGIPRRTEYVGPVPAALSAPAAVPALPEGGSSIPRPEQSPTRPAPAQAPAPVVVPSQAPRRPGFRARAAAWLGGGQQAPASLAQTGSLPAAPAPVVPAAPTWAPAPLPGGGQSYAVGAARRYPAPAPSLAAARRARRQAHLPRPAARVRPAPVASAPAPAPEPDPAPVAPAPGPAPVDPAPVAPVGKKKRRAAQAGPVGA